MMRRRSNRVAPTPTPPQPITSPSLQRPALSGATTIRHFHLPLLIQRYRSNVTRARSAYLANKESEREKVKLWLDSFDKVGRDSHVP